MRRPCPQAPPGFIETLNKEKVTEDDLMGLNQKAFDEYKEVGLIPCRNCNRSFNSNAYKIHMKMCFPDKPFKPLSKSPNQNRTSNAQTTIEVPLKKIPEKPSKVGNQKGIEIQTQTDESIFSNNKGEGLNLPVKNSKSVMKSQ